MTLSPQRKPFVLSIPTSPGMVLLALVGLVPGVMTGCASPGIPRPPSLHLPATVTDLTASRIGDRVDLHWTAPTRTTDGLDLAASHGTTAVEICRDPVYPPAEALPAAQSIRLPGGTVLEVRCTAVARAAGHAGPSDASDRLPANLIDATGKPTALAYRVRVLNESGRSAAPSPAVLVPGGPPVAGVNGFRATQGKAGVVLEWKANGSATTDDAIEIVRTLQQDVAAQTSAKPTPTRNPGAPSNRRGAAIQAHHAGDTHVVRLRAPEPQSGSAGPPDLRGMLDRSALVDQTYTYAAQRVRRIDLAGKKIEVRSEPTPAITIVMRDTFPPEPPRRLASIPGSMATAGQGSNFRPSIDLSWEPNAENDLAGYNVYRVAAGSGAVARKLNASPAPGPAYRDTEVVVGARYEYRVTAVDQRGNESSASAPVIESLEAP